jgi:two-component system sensor histidine kinase KdpD
MPSPRHFQSITDLPQETAPQLLDCILHITDTLNQEHLSSKKRMEKILHIVLDYLKAEQGSIMILDRKQLIVHAASRPEIIGKKQSVDSDSVSAWVAREGQPLFIEDIDKDPRFAKKNSRGYKKDALLCVPIFHQNKVAGVFNVSDKTGNRDLLKQDGQILLYFSSILLWNIILDDLQKTLKKQRSTLRKRNSELKKQEKLRSQLSSMLVHDLKAPLAEVVASLDILSYSATEENKEFIEGAQIGCDRAIRMVSNLVTIDKIADNKQHLLREEVYPDQLIQEAMTSIKSLAKLKNIETVFTCEDNPIHPLTIDRNLMLRVCQNILSNAVSYSPSGSKITAGISVTADSIRFMFVDQGAGIPDDMRNIIFDKYARISEAEDLLMGTGLGLHFCQLAVELHGGQIWVEGAAGGGSCFFIELPYTAGHQ